MKLRAIVADDSIIFRKVVRDCLADLRNVEVVDVAKDGESALQKIKQHRPDIVTLDVEMPGMNGLQVLEGIQRENISTNVIMISSHTQRGAATTTHALRMGAFDFILKPDKGDAMENSAKLCQELSNRIDSLRRRIDRPSLTTNVSAAPVVRSHATRSSSNSTPTDLDAICIGISTGGPAALTKLVGSLPASLSVPILVVQHMPPLFTKTLANGLNESSRLTVLEAENGMPLKGGTIYIAPGGKQMRVGGYPGAWTVEINNDPAIKSCRPSVDYLFASAAKQFGRRLLAIVMTGMGDDGLDGCRDVAKRGGSIWAQDEASSTVYGMPHKIVQAELADEVRSLSQIGDGISKLGCRIKAVR